MGEFQRIKKQFIKGLIVFLLFYNSWIFQYIPVILFNIDTTHITKSMAVMLSTFSSVLMFFILFFVYRKELRDEWDIFRKDILGCTDTGFKYWLLGLLGMFTSNLVLMFFLKTGQAGNERTVQTMISVMPWLMFIDAGILAPFIEEIVFRKCFKNIFKSRWIFIILSGFTFGLVHVLGNINVWTDWLFIIPYSCLGYAFAAAYYKTNTIYTSMFCHMFHNIILILISMI